VQSDAFEHQRGALNGDRGGGARLLVTDAGVGFLLVNEARRRLVERIFGVSSDQTVLVTLIAAGLLAQALHARATQAIGPPSVPALGDVAIAAGVAKDVGHEIAGDWSRDFPGFGALVAVVVLGTLFRPVLRWSFRDLKAAAHRTRIMFEHRYGHLLRYDRLRSRSGMGP